MKRTAAFSPNVTSTEFIETLNRLISDGERNTLLEFNQVFPLFIILGAPRSGTTLLLQWLSQIGIGSPSNLAARFYMNPYFGGMLQRLLSDERLNYREELTTELVDDFRSSYGKTKGLLAPHEFSYFVRQFFPVTVGEKLTACQRQQANPKGFVEGLQKFSNGLDMPICLKGLLFQYDLDLLASFKQVIFIHTHRDEIENTCSLIRQREIVAGDTNEWISVRPPQYEWLKSRPAAEQVAGQVHFTNLEIERQLDAVPRERKISLSHENFCEAPFRFYLEIVDRLQRYGDIRLPAYSGPKRFSITRYDAASSLYRSAAKALELVRG